MNSVSNGMSFDSDGGFRPGVDLGDFVCSGRATAPGTIPPFIWYVLSGFSLLLSVVLISSAPSLLTSEAPVAQQGGRIAAGLGGVMGLIALLAGYSGYAKAKLYKIHFHTNGLKVHGGPNHGLWSYHDVQDLAVHVVHPVRWLSPKGLRHLGMLLLGFAGGGMFFSSVATARPSRLTIFCSAAGTSVSDWEIPNRSCVRLDIVRSLRWRRSWKSSTANRRFWHRLIESRLTACEGSAKAQP